MSCLHRTLRLAQRLNRKHLFESAELYGSFLISIISTNNSSIDMDDEVEDNKAEIFETYGDSLVGCCSHRRALRYYKRALTVLKSSNKKKLLASPSTSSSMQRKKKLRMMTHTDSSTENNKGARKAVSNREGTSYLLFCCFRDASESN